MGKHAKQQEEKALRNAKYATKYRQRICKNKRCRHRSSKPGNCKLCGGEMKTK